MHSRRSSNATAVFGRPRRLRARRQIFALGLVVAIVIAVSATLSLAPLLSARRDNREITLHTEAVQEFVDLRTALAGWQFYVEPRFAQLSTTAAIVDPVDLAKGAQLADTLVSQMPVGVAALRAIGLQSAARDLSTANAAFIKSLSAIGVLSAGRPLAVIAAVIASERAAFTATWDLTSDAADQLRQIATADLHRSTSHLNDGRTTVWVVDAALVIIALATAGVWGQRARRRERTQRTDRQRRAFETVVQDALEMAQTEPEVYNVLGDALTASLPDLQVELLVADSSRAHFHRTLSTAPEEGKRDGCGVVSPFDCPATIRGHTLLFPTSRAINACPHLKDRPSGDCSAVCVAVSIGGNSVGVMHATGPDEVEASESDVRYLEISSRRASERVAMLQAFAKSESQAHSDPLTGLLNRRSLENAVHEIQSDGKPYTLAYADLDHFKILNDTHGHEAGDQALRLFSRIMRDSVRPGDLVSRYGGEEFVIVLPECGSDAAVAVLERLRERLALALTSGRVPSFTVSFGVTSATHFDNFDEVVARADHALLAAKAAGRNRVLLAEAPDPAVATT